MKKIFKNIIIVLIIGIFLILFVIFLHAYKGYNMFIDALESEPIAEKVELIKQKENYTLLSEVPQIYKEALIAVEDHRFYIHNGVDYTSILRAVINNLSRGNAS